MPEQKLILEPGINSEKTQTLNTGGWSRSNLIRWKDGLLEKIGGWAKMFAEPVVGVCRALHTFIDLDFNKYLAIGTNERLQLFVRGALVDITPLRRTADLTDGDFVATNGSSEVTVTDVGSNVGLGDWIEIPISVQFEPDTVGIVLRGYYKVVSVNDADSYVIDAGAVAGANSTASHTPEFTTTNGSDVVTVTINNHGYEEGDTFGVVVATSVGGIILSGLYLVESVVDANNFTIRAASGAASNATAYENGDDVIVRYLIRSGLVSTEQLVGWGAGGYGEGPYGQDGGIADAVHQQLRLWSLDNFGQNLVAQVNNGALYEWVPPVGLNNRATLISAAPDNNIGMFVAMPQAQVVVFGAEVSGTQDPLLIRWCDAGNYNIWTASITNQAGSYRLSRGSRCVGALQAQLGATIWTDTDMWSMQYSGPPFIYSFTMIGTNCGLLSQNGATTYASSVYWISSKGFFRRGGGGVEPITCPV